MAFELYEKPGEWTCPGIESYPQTEGIMSLQVPIDLHNVQSSYYFNTISLLFNAYSIEKKSSTFISPVQEDVGRVARDLRSAHHEYAALLNTCADRLGHPSLGDGISQQTRSIAALIDTVRATIIHSAEFIAQRRDGLLSGFKQSTTLSGAAQLLLYLPWLDISKRTSLLDHLPADIDNVVALHHRLVEQLDDFEQHMRHMNLLLLDVPSDTDLVVFAKELRLLAEAIHFLASPLLMQGGHPDLEFLAIPGRRVTIRRLEDNVIKHNIFGCPGRGLCQEERGQFHDHD